MGKGRGMKLEELVPPLNLCKLSPKGEFEDSALIWLNGEVIIRFIDIQNTIPPSIQKNIYPAPTLREIMKNIRSDEQFFCSFYDGEGDADKQSWSIGDGELDFFVRNGFEGKNPEELALKWWLKLKGIEYEK